jgi:hypothetical protein
MKKLTIILCATCLLGVAWWAQARTVMVVSGGGVAAAGCSGTFATGSVESFEKGAGQFCCTDGWTESDAGSVIDLYSATYAKCGTHSMAITYNGGTGTNKVYFDLGSSATTTRYIRFYIKAPAEVQNYKYMQLFQACADTSLSSCTFGIALAGQDVTTTTRIETSKYGGGFNAADYSQQITGGNEYRVELKIAGANGQESEAKLFDSAGTQVGTTYTRSMDAGDAAYRYLIFYDNYNNTDATARTIYYDAIQIGTSAYLGAVECP